MSSLVAHLWQAGRNERLAKRLLNELDSREWAVTVTFYSGLHYVEAAFTQIPRIQHSETSLPANYTKSIHVWREDLVFNNYLSIYTNFRKLRNSSMIARYLTNNNIPMGQPVEDYFNDTDVSNFISRDLDKIKRKTGFAN